MNYIRHIKLLLVDIFNKIKLNLGFRVDTEYGWYRNNYVYMYHCDHGGLLHNPNGPTIIYPDGEQFWYINGKRHRENGPAAINSAGRQFWFINGYDITDQITEWAKYRDIDLDNLTEMDKMIISLEWGNYGK